MAVYETDILSWSERQAALLRQVANGEAANEQPDWANIIEEVGYVGINALCACRSLLLQALLHDLMAEAWPLSRDVSHWRSEAQVARINAKDAYAPSMRRLLDLGDIYAKALRAMPETIDGQPPLPVPAECPVTLDEMLNGRSRRGPADPMHANPRAKVMTAQTPVRPSTRSALAPTG